MPSLMAMLGLDASRFGQGLQGSQRLAETTGKNIGSALGGGITGALAGFAGLAGIKKTFDFAMKMAEESKAANLAGSKMGISGEDFMQYDVQAKKFNLSGEAVAGAFKKIAVSATEALGGNLELVASFRSLGVTTKDLQNKSVAQIFDQVAHSLKGAEMNAGRVSAIIKTMGRNADDLIPAMRAGAFSVMNPFVEEQSAINNNAQFGKDVGVLKAAWGKIWDEVMSPDANKDGAINKTLRWVADKTRKYFGVQDANLGSPINLKNVAKGELEAEKKAKEQQKKDLTEINRLQEQLYEKQQANALKRLTDEQKIVELKRREAEIQGFINANATSEAGRLQAAIDIEGIRGELGDLTNKKTKRAGMEVNELQRIGAYVASPEMDAARRSERHLDEIKRDIKTLARRTETSGGGVQY